MKFLLVLIFLMSGPLYAYQDWFKGKTEFNFQACEDIQKRYSQAFNLDYKSEETKALRAQNDSCRLSSAKSFFQKYIQFSQTQKISFQGIKNGISIVSDSDLQFIYDELRKNPYFPYEVIETQSCFYRAKMIALFLESRNLKVGQVIAMDGQFIVKRPLYPDRTTDWDTHTAIYLFNSKGQQIVIDPSLVSTPVTLKEWTNIMTAQSLKKTFKLSFSANHITSQMQSYKNRPDKDWPLIQMSGVMQRDTFHLLNHTRPAPERITSDILPELMEFAQHYQRKIPNLTGEPASE